MKKATNTYHRRKLNFCSAVLTSPFASGILPLIAALTAEVLISIKSLSPCKLQERCRPRWSSNAAAPVRRLLRRVIDAATLNGSRIRPEWTEFHRNSSISAQPGIKPNRSKISAQFKFSAHKHPSHWIAAALPYQGLFHFYILKKKNFKNICRIGKFSKMGACRQLDERHDLNVKKITFRSWRPGRIKQ